MADMDREFSWDDEIQNDGADFEILPEGDYNFEVTGVERGRHIGTEKLPPCGKAILTLKITSDDGEHSTTIMHNLFLHSRMEGLLCSFFTAIGQRKKGEKMKMNWNLVTGARGRCKIGVHKWIGKDGEEKTSNQIKKFYEPQYGSQHQQTWKTGEF